MAFTKDCHANESAHQSIVRLRSGLSHIRVLQCAVIDWGALTKSFLSLLKADSKMALRLYTQSATDVDTPGGATEAIILRSQRISCNDWFPQSTIFLNSFHAEYLLCLKGAKRNRQLFL